MRSKHSFLSKFIGAHFSYFGYFLIPSILSFSFPRGESNFKLFKLFLVPQLDIARLEANLKKSSGSCSLNSDQEQMIKTVSLNKQPFLNLNIVYL